MDKSTLEKLNKLLDTSPTEMEKMLAILDIEHSIIIDNNIGLIGEFKDKKRHRLTNKLMSFKDITEKRGDYFTVIGEFGEIVLNEKAWKTCLIQEPNTPITKYLFILYEVKVPDIIDTFLDNEDISVNASVIYDSVTGELRTNCKNLGYTYDKDIQLVDEFFKPGLGYQLYDHDKEYTSLELNEANGIYLMQRVN